MIQANYSLLKELIGLIEEFQRENTSQRMEDFILWLNNKIFNVTSADAHTDHDTLVIGFKILHLNKELKKQAKSALSESCLSSIDEYSFLLHLDHHESFRKMEIIDMHNLEAPTGIEIIKRLLKSHLISEFEDSEDKRAKRIRITTKGREELHLIKPKMETIFRKFTLPLNLNEKIQINGILNKLI